MVRRSRRKPSPAESLVSQGQETEYPRRRRDRQAAGPETDLDRLRRAIAKYSKAIELDPHLVGAYIRRAAARRQSGDLQGARADALAAYKLRPSDPMDYL